MPSPFEVADAIQERLRDLDLTALALLEESYQAVLAQIEQQLAALDRQLEATPDGAPVRGQSLRPRLEAARDEIRRILVAWGRDAATIVELAQERALSGVGAETTALIGAMLGTPPPGARLPSVAVPAEAINALVGMLGQGSPLRDYFDSLGDQMSQALMDRYLSGLAAGLGPRTIAAQARAITGEPRRIAQATARTATIGAYREAQHRIFQANTDVVSGWTWSATLDARTCVVCWAMHGTQYPASARMSSHWNCRCAMLPRTKTWRELGFPGGSEPPRIEPGPAQFARLDEATQRQILGPGKLARYQAGQIDITDLVASYDDAIWGPMLKERPLRDL